MNTPKPILIVDARPLARGKSGIQRYLNCLLPHIVNSNEYQIYLYSDLPVGELPVSQNQSINVRTINTKFASSLLWFLVVPIWLRIDKGNIYWSPRHQLPLFIPKTYKKVVTIHDFVWKEAPSTMPWIKLQVEKRLMPFALKSSTAVACVSNTTRTHLGRFFPQHLSKTTAILNGWQSISSSADTPRKERPKYFIAVGTLEPRKNYEALLRAFDLYCKNNGTHSLLIIGNRGWKYSTILDEYNRTRFRARVEVIEHCSDKKLKRLYQNASGFISVSLAEGFGLPAQEAALHNTPLLLSDIEVYKELYPFADAWADPMSITDIAKGMSKLETAKSNTDRALKIESTHPSWQATADQLMRLL